MADCILYLLSLQNTGCTKGLNNCNHGDLSPSHPIGLTCCSLSVLVSSSSELGFKHFGLLQKYWSEQNANSGWGWGVVFSWGTSVHIENFFSFLFLFRFQCYFHQKVCTPGLLQRHGDVLNSQKTEHVKNIPALSYKAPRFSWDFSSQPKSSTGASQKCQVCSFS